MSENLHAKHRERMRKRYLATGENGFQDHELLELILFYTIPRKDTNEIAHRLLHRFQTLEGVFSASIDELTQVVDIGPQSAIFIKTVFDMHNRLLRDDERTTYTTYEEIGEMLLKKYKHIEVETLVLFLFDKKGRINREAIISVGNSDEAMLNMKNIVAVSASQGAYFAVVAHNHPSGNPKSSFDDKVSTLQIKEALENLNIKLKEHYVIADGVYTGVFHDDYTMKQN